MSTDYPAAHSMDTTWFAVDRDGHVGCFYSSEAGSVPVAALVDGPDALYDRLANLLPRGEVIYDLHGHLLAGPRQEASRHRFEDRGDSYGALLFLKSLAPVRRQLTSGEAVAVPATTGFAVTFRRLSDATAGRLHKDGHCLGCFFSYFPEEGDEHRVRPAEVGLFEYVHPSENWISQPYGRLEVPRHPLHIDQLPPALRDEFSEGSFPTLSFPETTHLQPAEFGEVATWEPAYLTADGRTVRATNNLLSDDIETTYTQFYEGMTAENPDWLAGIHFEPPRKR